MHRILGRIRDNGDWRTAAGEAFGGQGSFGNGAAMRAAPIGAFFADDLERVVAQAAISAKTTHAHPEGVAGAVAVAVAAAWAVRFRVAGNKVAHSEFLRQIAASTPSSEVRDRLLIAQSLDDVRSLQFPAAALGNGTQMSAPDTVPYALWCSAQSLSDFESAMWLAIGAGGDRDTLAAIVGGVVASFVGSNAIPPAWRESREPLPEWHVSQ
ncbi:MAG TPA: ADP-ribosylglycohydrolase family protein [Pirellulales bacterium]